MDFAQEQRKPAKHLVGIVVVVLLHIVLVWGLANGLVEKVRNIVHPPVKVTIEETPKQIEPPPPPPPPPQIAPPPQNIFIPTPQVEVNAPPPPPTAVVLPQSDVKPAEMARPQPAAPTAPAAPPREVSVGAVCTNAADMGEAMKDKFSKVADEEGITTGKLLAIVHIGPNGQISGVDIKNASHSALKSIATRALMTLRCKGSGVEQEARYEVTFNLE